MPSCATTVWKSARWIIWAAIEHLIQALIDYFHIMRKLFRSIICYSLPMITFCGYVQATENHDGLASQIMALQSQMKFRLSGLEKIGDEQKASTSGSLEQQLRQALVSYNHIINQNPKGKIEQVVIINKKQKTDTGRIVLPIRNQDGHSLVSVDLSGDGALWQTLDMTIDTGADLIVLPESMIASLGLAEFTFMTRKMQTANGEMTAKIGTLQKVRLAGETLEGVEMAFVGDQLLGNNRLLGMSALGRYRLTIDDQSQLIALFKK
jgi:aspartyl protease family protein